MDSSSSLQLSNDACQVFSRVIIFIVIWFIISKYSLNVFLTIIEICNPSYYKSKFNELFC